MFMSVFFLSFSVLTFILSHWRAKRTKPALHQFQWTKSFSGNLNEFTEKLLLRVQSTPELLLLERGKFYFLIGQEPTAFEYGAFYKIHCKEIDNQLIIKVSYQSKLVSFRMSDQFPDELLFKEIPLDNVI